MNVTYTLVAILITVLTAIYIRMKRRLNYWKRRNVPFAKPHPIYGNMKGFRSTRNMHSLVWEFYTKMKNCGAPFAGFYFLLKPTAFIFDRSLAKSILIRDFSNFRDRGLYHNVRDDPLTGHLFNLDGDKWTEMRHKLSPTFTSGKMKFMFPTVVDVAQRFIGVMDELLPKPTTADAGANVEIKDLMSRYTTDVIGSCAFGIECNSLRDPHAQFRIMGRKAFTEMRHKPYVFSLIMSFPNAARKLGMRIIPEDVHQFFMGVVRDTVALRKREQIQRQDFMDMLIKMKHEDSTQGLTLEEIAAQCFVFFLAGFETSSSTMTFALYELAKHQHIQDKLRKEINHVLDKHDQVVSYEAIKDMRYLDQVLSETLRLYTLVPALLRVALKDYNVPDHPGLIIEKGTQVMVPASGYHRDPDIYPEPEQFRPERFDADQVAARDSVDWLPFGDGPRNCIGKRFGQMQSRIGLALLVKQFKFTVGKETEIPLKFDPKSFALATKGGLHLQVQRV